MPRILSSDALLSVEEVARRLSLDEPIVKALIEAEWLAAVRVNARWKVPPEALAEFRQRIVRGEVPRNITPINGVIPAPPKRSRGGNRGGNSTPEPVAFRPKAARVVGRSEIGGAI